MTFNPCDSTCQTHAYAAALINFQYTYDVHYPEIRSQVAVQNIQKTSVRILVNISAPGNVYCAAFDAHKEPASLVDIKLGGSSVIVQRINGNHFGNITIASLNADSNYDIYCYTDDFGIYVMPLNVALTSKISVQTACCRQLVVQSAPKFIYQQIEGSTIPDSVYSLSLSAAPQNLVQVNLTIYRVSCPAYPTSPPFQKQLDAVALPWQFYFDSKSPSLVATFTLRSAVKGCYLLEAIAISKTNVDKYSPVNISFSVESYRVTPDAPKLTSAEISNDGYNLNIIFNTATDIAASSIFNLSAQQFNCSLLVVYPGSSLSVCRWASSSVLTAVLGRTVYPSIGSSITLFAGTVRAACIVGTDCSSYRSNVAITFPISAPLNPVKPTIGISAPSFVSYCDDLTLDASVSTGSGGKPWVSVQWRIDSSTTVPVENADQIMNYINAHDINSPISVPKSFLLPYAVYSISLELKNFLMQSSIGRVTVQIAGSTIPYPRVAIYSSNTASSSWKTNVFFASATYASCASSSSNDPLQYEWKVYIGNSYLSNIQSNSKDPRYLSIAPYTLKPNTYYTIMVTVSLYSSSGINVVKSNATTVFFLGSSGVSSTVAGGSSRVAGIANSVNLDASASYDIDYPSTSLVFNWYCVNVYPNFGSSCISTSASQFSNSGTSVLTIPAGSLQIGQYNITVGVYSPQSRITSNTTVFLNIVGNNVPGLYITAPRIKYNPSDKIVLTGFVTTMADNATAMWSTIQSTGIEAPFLNYTTLERSFRIVSASSNQINTFQCALGSVPSTQFPSTYSTAGQSYVFQLLASYSSTPRLFSSSSVTVVINAPPSSGVLQVSPSKGSVMSTLFTLITSNWIDDLSDLPLRYLFQSYDLSPSSALTIRELATIAFAHTYLGQGLESRNFKVALVVVAYDIYNGFANASSSVSVMPMSGTDITGATASAVSNAFARYDTSAVAAAVGASLSSVNSVDCAVPVSCSRINRGDCRQTARTCSKCLPEFLGVDGDSNLPCQLPTKLKNIGDNCVSNSSCATGWCFDKKCTGHNKLCPGNCGVGGSKACIYSDLNGNKVPQCWISDSLCRATCQCPKGSYGRDCSLSKGRYVSLINFREYLCSTQLAVVHQSDSTLNTLLSTAQLVQDIFVDQTQISPYALYNCSDSLILALRNALKIEQSAVCENNAGATIVSALSAISSSSIISDYPLLLGNLTNLLYEVGTACLQSAVVGEASSTISSDAVNIMTIAVDSSQGISLRAPQSSFSNFIGVAPSVVTVPSTSSDGVVGLAITRFNINPTDSVINSTSIGIQISPQSTSSTSANGRRLSTIAYRAPNVTVDLQNSAPIVYRNLSSDTFVIKCLSMKTTKYFISYRCHNTTVYNATCPANSRGLLTAACPGYQQIPQCLVWNGANYVSSKYCHVLQYNSTTTTCSCSSLAFPASSTAHEQRFSSATIAVDTSSAQRFQQYESLSEVEHDSVITSSVYSVVAVFILLLLCHVAWDRRFFVRSRIEFQSLKYKSEYSNRRISIVDFFDSIFPDDEFIVEPWYVKYSRLMITKNCWFRGFALTCSRLPASFTSKKKEHIFFQHAPVLPDLGSTKWIIAVGKLLSCFLISCLIMYFIAPDDGSCQEQLSISSCNNRKSLAGWFKSCEWNTSNESCDYSPPPSTFSTYLPFIFIVLLLSSPFEYAIECFVNNITCNLLCGDLLQKVSPDIFVDQSNDADLQKVRGRNESTSQRSSDLAQLQQSLTWKGLLLRAARLEKSRRTMDFVLVEDEMLLILRNAERALYEYRRATENSRYVAPTVYHFSRYGFTKLSDKMIRNRVNLTRSNAKIVESQFDSFESNIQKQMYLVREFIVDYFDGYKRQIIKKVLSKRDKRLFLNSFSGWTIYLQRASYLLLIALLVLIVMFILQISDRIGSGASNMWLQVTLLAVVVDIFAVRPIVIYLDAIFIDDSVNADLQFLLRYFKRHCKLILRRTTGVMRDTNSLVQHFNPSCRVARMHPSWPICRMLFSLGDNDLPRKPIESWPVFIWNAFLRSLRGVVFLHDELKNFVLYVAVVCLSFGISLALYQLTVAANQPAVACIILIPVLVVVVLEVRIIFIKKKERRLEEQDLNTTMFDKLDQIDQHSIAKEDSDKFDDDLFTGMDLSNGDGDLGSVWEEKSNNSFLFSPSTRRLKPATSTSKVAVVSEDLSLQLEPRQRGSVMNDAELINMEDDSFSVTEASSVYKKQRLQTEMQSQPPLAIQEDNESMSVRSTISIRRTQSTSLPAVAGPPLSSSSKRVFQNGSTIKRPSYATKPIIVNHSPPITSNSSAIQSPISPFPLHVSSLDAASSISDSFFNTSLVSVMEGFEADSKVSIHGMPRSETSWSTAREEKRSLNIMLPSSSVDSADEQSTYSRNSGSISRTLDASPKKERNKRRVRHSSKKTPSENKNTRKDPRILRPGPGEKSGELLVEKEMVNTALNQMQMSVDAAMPVGQFMGHSVYRGSSPAPSVTISVSASASVLSTTAGGVGPGSSIRGNARDRSDSESGPTFPMWQY